MSDYQNDLSATLDGAINDAISRRLLDVHTAIPGVVESYDASTQTAEVAVAVNRFKADGTRIPGPKLPNVPVLFPKSSAGHLHWPLSSGDEVLILCCERDIDGWRQAGRQADPLSRRKFSLTDAVCVPGCNSTPNGTSFDSGDESALTVYFGTLKVVMTPGGQVRIGKQGGTQDEPIPLGAVLASFLDAIITTLKTVPAGLTTTPPNPITVNPALISALDALKTQYIDTSATNILSQVAFTERGT